MPGLIRQAAPQREPRKVGIDSTGQFGHGSDVRTWMGWSGAAVALACVIFSACKKKPGQAQERVLETAGYAMTQADFFRAAESDDLKALKEMLAAGLDLRETDEEGRTVLHAAAGAGAEQAIAFLLDQGMEPDPRDNRARTPLMEAVERGKPGAVKFLLRQGASPEARDVEDYKPLMLAVRAGRPDMVAVLAPYVRAELDDALLLSALLGEAATIDELTNYGASIYTRLDDGRTPLMLAAQNGHEEAVKMLLEIGASRFAMDSEGRTAADLARESGQENLARLLETQPTADDFSLPPVEEPGETMLAEMQSEIATPSADGSAMQAPGNNPRTGSGGDGHSTPPKVRSLEGAVLGNPSAHAGHAPTHAPAQAGAEPESELSPGTENPTTAPTLTHASPPLQDPSLSSHDTPVIMRSYRQDELPLRFEAAASGKATVQVVDGTRHEVAVGNTIPGSPLRVVEIKRRTQSGKENQGYPMDVSVVTVTDQKTGVSRDMTVGNTALAYDPAALLEDPATGSYYLARSGQQFRMTDGTRYLVSDVRPSQVVLVDLDTGKSTTIALRGPRG